MDWKRLLRGSAPEDPPAESPEERAREVVRAYHERTKHAPQRFARGPGYLDWETQPDPFRRWAGAEVLTLQHPPIDAEPRYEEVFVAGRLAPRPLDQAFVSQLFRDSLALSAWKRAGEARWSLRVNPSSGNLHPTEGYLIAPAVRGLSPTPLVAHYAPREHALEVRARFEPELWRELTAGLPPDSLLVAFTSIHWREAWKYGERAWRYGNHDVGHALACATLAAAALGYRARLLDGLGTGDVATLLHLTDTRPPEAEEPDAVLALHPAGTSLASDELDTATLSRFATLSWQGTPNELSPEHVEWDVIDVVARQAAKPRGARAVGDFAPPWPPLAVGDEPIPFRRIVHQRRSAVALDGRSALALDAFFQTLRRTLPGRGEAPFDALPWSPRVHLALFVHRVADLAPGLYLLVRNPSDEVSLRAALQAELRWLAVPQAPAELPLWRLREGDARGLAARVSCDQAIAGDGCFSMGMLARFGSSIEEDGAWMYPRLFWECGVIGQALYLEAEALGLRATGIGCFYDDAVHELLGLREREWQSLYHFTVGGALEDARIQQEPAYPERP